MISSSNNAALRRNSVSHQEWELPEWTLLRWIYAPSVVAPPVAGVAGAGRARGGPLGGPLDGVHRVPVHRGEHQARQLRRLRPQAVALQGQLRAARGGAESA